MHCSAEQQKIMARLYKEILRDIYILDENNPPERYPSPEELKGMFIIKDSRNRLFRKEAPAFSSHRTAYPVGVHEKVENILTCPMDTNIDEEKHEDDSSDFEKSIDDIRK